MAIFGRQTPRRRLKRAARQSLMIPAFSAPVDCTPWVLGDLWPVELATVTAETATLAEHLDADLRRIVHSANDQLQQIGRAGLVGRARHDAEARVVKVARAFAVQRVESTVRQLREQALEFPAAPAVPAQSTEPDVDDTAEPNPASAPADTDRDAPAEADGQRVQRLLDYVARQEPGLRWAIGVAADGATVLVTDLAHGWIPPGIDLPAGVRLLTPGRHGAEAATPLGVVVSAAYAPGDRLGWPTESESTEASPRPRELPAVDDLGWLLAEATHWRDGLPQLANTLAKAGAAGTGVADAELDVLQVHLDTARNRLLARYPDVDPALLLNTMLLAAAERIAAGDRVSANYHFSWFQALNTAPASGWHTRP